MNKLKIVLLGLLVVFSLSGCVIYKSESFLFDDKTGTLKLTFHDLCSMKEPDNKDYSVSADWTKLKDELRSHKEESVPTLFKEVSRSLYQENKGLSGKVTYTLLDFKNKPDKTNILLSFGKDYRFMVIQDEIYLFLPSDRKIVSSNGQTFSTTKSTIIVWPLDEEDFEFTEALAKIDTEKSALESLLPNYLKEQAK